VNAIPLPEPAARARIRVLIVEDDQVDRMACRRAFAADPARALELLEADHGEDGLEIARRERPDCILLDYNLPDLTGLEFLARLATQAGSGAPAVPVMMLTGADSAAVAAEAMRRGARDYLVKDVDGHYLELLPAAIERMLREQRLLDEKHQVEARFRTLVEQIQAITYMAPLGAGPGLLYVSPQIAVLGFSPAEWTSQPDLCFERMHPDDRAFAAAAIRASRHEASALNIEYRLLARDGSVLWFRDQASVVRDAAGTPLLLQGLMVEITAIKRAEAELRESQAELRRLAAYQETIKEDERKRIAREIHDELGGLLTGIKAYISVAIERATQQGREPEPLLAETAGLAQTAIETVRRVITDLRPSVLDQLGVWAALEWYVDQVAGRTTLECICVIDPSAAALELDPERSTMVFRVAQEALTNVVRHAAASRVRLDARVVDGVLRMTVTDNGKGIEAGQLLSRDSWGILGMHERTRNFAGDLRVHGAPGAGTTLQLDLPLEGIPGE
jgi:two-component system sensor histidine kinase UhpB